MKRYLRVFSIVFFITPSAFTQSVHDTICILQLNDVYEIGPLNQGKSGGMARVATLIKQYETRYQTFVVLAGDFVNPSVIGTTKIDGQKVNGKQIVDIMNKTGIDLVTFGNHEFDIPENDLQQRINESQFAWVSSDVLHKNFNGTVSPFYKTKPDSVVIPTHFLLSSLHDQFKIGIISATIQSNKPSWVEYNNILLSVKKAWKQVRRQSDIVIGLTHLSLAEDEKVLRKLKHISLIMGGHEHEHNYVTIRKSTIAKADANAKTLYRHIIYRDGRRKKIKIISELINVDTTVVPDPMVTAAVKEWEEKAYASFRSIGLEPDAVVYHTAEPLDGTGESIRNKQTNLGSLIAQSMLAASPQAEAAILNSGSVRIDDVLEGVITQLDIIRVLPFGGKLCEVDISGFLLNQLLVKSNSMKGLGGYLQLSANISFDGTNWLLNGTAIDSAKTYKIVSAEFLFSGAEKGLEFLKEGAPGIKSLNRFDAPGDIRTDLRLAVVKYLSGLEK
ncbi:MAG: bifunctional metallophosphatase/5'-nucleotidase [Ginsengibacter sp.]